MWSTKDSACVKDRCVELAGRSRDFHSYSLRMYPSAASFLEGLRPFKPRKFEAITGL